MFETTTFSLCFVQTVSYRTPGVLVKSNVFDYPSVSVIMYMFIMFTPLRRKAETASSEVEGSFELENVSTPTKKNKWNGIRHECS